MSFIVATRQSPHGILIVVTDQSLVGKKFVEGNKQLDLTLQFYSGETKTIEEVKQLFRDARHLHLTGEEIVALGVSLDYVDPERILRVEGIPHAEVVVA